MRRQLGTIRLLGWLGLKSTFAGRNSRSLARIFGASIALSLVILSAVAVETALQVEGSIRAWRAHSSSVDHDETGLWLHSQRVPTGSGTELTILTVLADEDGGHLGWPEFNDMPPNGALMVSESIEGLDTLTKQLVADVLSIDVATIDERATVPTEMLVAADELVAVRLGATSDYESLSPLKPIEVGVRREMFDPPNVALVTTGAVIAGAATMLVSLAGQYLRGATPTLATLQLLGLSRGNVQSIAVFPIGVAAIGGAVVGAFLIEGVRLASPALDSSWLQFYASRAELSAAWSLICPLLVGFVACAAALRTIRRVSHRPLEHARGDERARSRPVLGSSLLFIGVSMLVWREVGLDSDARLHILLWWLATPLILAGLLAVLRALLHLIVSRRWSGASALIGAGIVRSTTTESRSLFEPTLAVLYICTLLIPLMSGIEPADDLTSTARASIMFNDTLDSPSTVETGRSVLNSQLGEDQVGLVGTNFARTRSDDEGGAQHSKRIWMGDCEDLAILLGSDVPDCAPGVVFFPPGTRPDEDPAGLARIGFEGDLTAPWRAHTGNTSAAYWVVTDLATQPQDLTVSRWLVASADEALLVSSLAEMSSAVPNMQAVIPEELRRAQQESARLLRGLVLTGVAVTMGLAILTYLSNARNYLAGRTRFMEHLIRLGVGRKELLIITTVVITGPFILGSPIVIPSSLVVGRLLAEDATTSFPWWLLATVLTLVTTAAVMGGYRILRLGLTAPGRWSLEKGV